MKKLEIVNSNVNLGDVYNALREVAGEDMSNFKKIVMLVKAHDHQFVPWIEKTAAAILALVKFSEFESYEHICSTIGFLIVDNECDNPCEFELDFVSELEEIGIDKDWVTKETGEAWASSAVVYTAVITWLALALGLTPDKWPA